MIPNDIHRAGETSGTSGSVTDRERSATACHCAAVVQQTECLTISVQIKSTGCRGRQCIAAVDGVGGSNLQGSSGDRGQTGVGIRTRESQIGRCVIHRQGNGTGTVLDHAAKSRRCGPRVVQGRRRRVAISNRLVGCRPARRQADDRFRKAV